MTQSAIVNGGSIVAEGGKSGGGLGQVPGPARPKPPSPFHSLASIVLVQSLVIVLTERLNRLYFKSYFLTLTIDLQSEAL